MIRAAAPVEASDLSNISMQAKRYWKYPEEYYQLWEQELLITPEYINNNVVFVYEEQGKVVAYYSIVNITEDRKISEVLIFRGFWLDHMFVKPDLIATGIGKRMFAHLNNWCLKNCIEEIHILADPNSQGFYEKMGCSYQQEYPSTIPGRTTPLLRFQIGSGKLRC